MIVRINWISGRSSTMLKLTDDDPLIQQIKSGKILDLVQRFSLNGSYPITILNLEYAEEITLVEE